MTPKIASFLSSLCISLAALAPIAHGATIIKANTTTALNATGSWTGGVVPGSADIAKWDATVTSAKTSAVGGNLSIAGIQVTNPTGLQTINTTASSTLTLGTSGIDMSAASADLTVSSTLAVGGAQSWSIASGRTLTIGPGSGVSNTGTAGVTVSGPGNLRLGNGTVYFGSGSVTLTGGVNIGSTNSTARSISNAVTLSSDITVTSLSATSNAGFGFLGDVTVGSTNRTITLVTTTGSATLPVLSIGGGTSKTLSGTGTLIFANGNASLTPTTSATLDNGVTVQSGLEVGNGVMLYATSASVVATSAGLTVDSGGTFNMARDTAGLSFSQTVGSLSGSGLVTSNAATTSNCTLTVDGGSGTTTSTFSGQVTNSAGATMSLVKTGSTTQVLTGNSTFSGATTVSGGFLQLGSSSSTANFLPSNGRLNLNTGGVLKLSYASNSNFQMVGSLYINGTAQATGSWGAVGSGATNTSSLITGTGTLLVGAVPPTFTTQPIAQTVNAGDTATFTTAASGSPTPTYQWRFNGTNLSGQTGTTLTLTGVTTAQAGNYDVVATNSAGSATSTAVTLTVNIPPTITTQPVAQTVVSGGNASFSVAATGSPSPTYQWQFNGTNLSGQTSSTLSLTGVTPSQAGNYAVVVTNVAGSVTSSTAALTVNVPPSITTQPVAQTVNTGGSASFSVVATGTPSPSYQWMFNGANLSGQTSSTLTLTGVTLAQAGNYSVAVSNVAGSTTSSQVTLTVNVPPTITSQPVSQIVTNGNTAVFSVSATGIPSPAYQWQFNGSNMTGQTASTLTIASVAPANAGNYAVVVSNTAGSVTSNTVTLNVADFIVKANNTTALNVGGSWTGGVLPTSAQVARWTSTVTTTTPVSIGGSVSFAGLQITNPAGAQTISATASSVLSLGTQGIDLSSATADLTVNSLVNISSDQIWNVATGRTLTLGPGTGASNTGTATVTLAGPGNVRLGNGTVYFGSGTVALKGGVNLGSSGSTGRTISNAISLNSDITVSSVNTTSSPGLVFSGNVALGNVDRTVTLKSTATTAAVPAFGTGNGTTSYVTGSGKLILINGNAAQSPPAGAVFQGGATVQTGVEIGNGVTVFAPAVGVLTTSYPLIVDAGGTLDMARTTGTGGGAFSQQAGALSGAGLITSDATTAGTTCTLTVLGSGTSTSTFSGQITNSGGATVSLTKDGPTTQVLTGSNSYSGTTLIKGGVLRLGSNSAVANFLNTSSVMSFNGGTLDLSFANNTVQQGVGSLVINGVQQAYGVYGPVGSGAQFENVMITGTGLLRAGIITSQPVGATKYVGDSVTFAVGAATPPTPTYQWLKNGTNIPGATSSSLTISSVTLSDAGSYTVLVGSQLSAAATLIVNQIPIVSAAPTSISSVDGVNASFSCTVTGFPLPTFQWQLNGVNISPSRGTFTVSPDGLTATFTLNGLTTSDAGTYTVIATNSQGSVTSTGATLTVSSNPNIVNVQMGGDVFSWTFDQAVSRGYFVDGMPWIVMPSGGNLHLTAASPTRLNAQTAYVYNSSTPVTADINITVKNPIFDHTYNTTTNLYVDNPAGVFGWDSRSGTWGGNASPKYNNSPTLGWDGTTAMSLAVGDSITTPKSLLMTVMPDRSTPLQSLAVLTVLGTAPPSDAFRPGIYRTGTDRTNPEILRYSSLINLTPYLIANPTGVTSDLRGVSVTGIPPQYTWDQIKLCMQGPGLINTGNSVSEGANALLNNYNDIANAADYGGTMGGYMGQLGIGSLASWLTEDQRKVCRIRYIQRAIDSYASLKSGLCLEESAGILPGYSTLITTAGVMINHTGMKNISAGLNGVKPWWMLADFACMFHTDNVPSTDLSSVEVQADRLVPLYSATTTNYSELSMSGITPVATSGTNTMAVRTDFLWSHSRPINNIIGMKVKITGGTGAGSTIYVITNAVVTGVTDAEKFRLTANGTDYYPGSGNTYGYYYGGKVQVKPAWQNGTPDTTSVMTFSITSNDPNDLQSDNASWYYCPGGVTPVSNPSHLERVKAVCCSPTVEYGSVHTGGTVDNLITLYALGQQDLYKGAVDKYLIRSGERPGYGEALFAGSYLEALGTGGTGCFRGALWKQIVLNPLGETFQYTGQGTSALAVPDPAHAKMWNEP